MATYRECVFMVLDALKITSDDSPWETSHIAFELDNARALLIKQRYSHYRVDVPFPYYQRLKIDLLLQESGKVSKSIKTLPSILNLNGTEIESSIKGEEDTKYNLVSIDRLPYVGRNKYLSNSIYCAFDYDRSLIIKWPLIITEDVSNIPTYVYSDVILEHPADIIKFSGETINPLDLEFPAERAALEDIIGICTKKFMTYNYLPTNEVNDAADSTPTNVKVK